VSRNGLLTSRELGAIPGTSHRVRKDLVVQTAALRAAFAKRFGKPLELTDSYRPYSVQERIFRQRYTTSRVTGIDPRWWNGAQWWRLPGNASAATPGTSNHGWGTAIDWASRVNVGGSAEQKWMAANASRFGWTWPTWARNPANAFYEPWHYEATPVPVSAYRSYLTEHGITVPDVPTLVPLEDDMPTSREIVTELLGTKLGRSEVTVAQALQTQIAADAATNVLAARLGRSDVTVAQALQTEIARSVATALTPVIAAAAGSAAGGAGVTPTQVETLTRRAAEAAIRDVFGSLKAQG